MEKECARITRTKIVATLGPASNAPDVMRGLIRAGMDVARINFSHGDLESHARTIAVLRQVAEEEGRVVALMADLQGPRLRVGEIAETVVLRPGEVIALAARPGEGMIPLPYPDLLRALQVGQPVLLDEGRLELVVVKPGTERVECRVVSGGPLTSHKGVNVPGANLPFSALTPKDRRDAEFALAQGASFLALSFVRRAEDVRELRLFLQEKGGDAAIIAKIEKAEALVAFDEILAEADGVMVARGDLGVEAPAEQVPFHQKRIIRACNRAAKPVITATQMLQSMVEHPHPTRAEASDVANAVLDGTDAVMLSGETAIGRYPVAAVETMETICANAETHLPYGRLLDREPRSHGPVAEAISLAAVEIASEVGAGAIVTPTTSGATARLIARHRPPVPIIAVTSCQATRLQLSLVWGVTTVQVPPFDTFDDMLRLIEREMLEKKLVAVGDRVVFTAGLPFGYGETNLLQVRVIGGD